MKKIAVIGSGPMGLVVAYDLLKQGYAVEVFERDTCVGGMTASFDLGGIRIERFYHFICATDYPYFALLEELGIADKLRWRQTKMGFFFHGKLYPWSNPFDLLRFPHLSLLSKIRYSLHILAAKNTRSWKKLDTLEATAWLKRWIGNEAYSVLWESLLRLKYHELRHCISAAWIASRIQRVARSRKSVFQEKLGYLEGGSEILLEALCAAIEKRGGTIRLSQGVQKLLTRQGEVCGIVTADGAEEKFDGVISTAPLPAVQGMAADLSEDERKRIRQIQYIGVICVALKLRSSFTENFWTNINDPAIEIPGIVEYTNLYPQTSTVLYVPYYLPHTHPRYQLQDAEILEQTIAYLKRMRPEFCEAEIESHHVSRYHCAQALCTPHFFGALPPMRTSIRNFLMADTSYYYPEDRSISESVKLGHTIAAEFTAYDTRTAA